MALIFIKIDLKLSFFAKKIPNTNFSVKLVVFCSFLGWQLLRQGSDNHSAVAMPFFYACEYVSHPFWRMAILTYRLMLLGVCSSLRPHAGIDVDSIESKS